MTILRRFRRFLREAALKKTPLNERRHIIQKGGFIGALLSTLISGLGSVLGQGVAKRMVLEDEKLLEYQLILHHFQTKQYMSWKRPTEQSVKLTISHQMKSELDNPTLPEDVKAKQYAQNLCRFLHTKRKLIEPEVSTQPVEPEKTVKRRQKRKRSPLVQDDSRGNRLNGS